MRHSKKQNGAVLVVGLVLLLVATILGVAALSSSITEERIAGNQRQIALAFMGAETGIARAIEWFETEDQENDTVNHSNPAFWDNTPNIGEIEAQIHEMGQWVNPVDEMVRWSVSLAEFPENPKDFVIIRSTGAVMGTPTTRDVEVLYARKGGGFSIPAPEAAYQCFGPHCTTRTGSNSNSAVYYDGRAWAPPEDPACTGSGCDGTLLDGEDGVAGIFLVDRDKDDNAISTGNQGGDSRPGQIQGNPDRAYKSNDYEREAALEAWETLVSEVINDPKKVYINAAQTNQIPAEALGSREQPTILHIDNPQSSGEWLYESIAAQGNTHGAGIIVISGDVDFTTAAGTATFEGLIILTDGAKLTGGKGTFNVFGSIVSLQGNRYTDDAEGVDEDIVDADLTGNFTLKYTDPGILNFPGKGLGGSVSGVRAWTEIVGKP